MRKIYIVRHGQTDTNELDIVSGENGVLSEKGKQQAQKLAERFLHVNFDHLLTSDYERAVETASFIAEVKGKTLVIEPLIRELGRPTEFLGKSRTSPEYLAFLNTFDENINDPNWHFSDEENFFDIFKRVEELFVKLEALDGDMVIVSHARIIALMTLFVLMGKKLIPDVWKIGMKNMIVSNTGITTFAYNEKNQHWQLQMFNDRAHFAE
ncbi:MAG: histidine phosphatase family protein [Candidatus Pacebacteria bacterium]|nr:histidine phosphatase family protein [Candidatus Paceibacterota bacterium]